MADFTNTGLYTLLEERVVRFYFETTLPLKLRDATLHRQSMPPEWVANRLFAALKESVNNLARVESGQMYVYCGEPKSGKSAAGAAIIEMALDKCSEHNVQNYRYLFVDAGSDLPANMRRQLGVPDTITDENVWLTLLFEKLKFVRSDVDEQEESAYPWWDKLTTLCGGGGGSRNDFEEYVNQVKSAPPIIVIDDFRKLDSTAYDLLRKIYQRAARSRVMVFVFTDDAELANYVSGMNGKERVRPLPRRFTVMDDLPDWLIVNCPPGSFPRKIAQGIVWTPEEWPKAMLTRIVQKRYPKEAFDGYMEDNGCLSFVIAGESPTDSLLKAADVLAGDFDFCPLSTSETHLFE
jgi:hypothetical protein